MKTPKVIFKIKRPFKSLPVMRFVKFNGINPQPIEDVKFDDGLSSSTEHQLDYFVIHGITIADIICVRVYSVVEHYVVCKRYFNLNKRTGGV